MPETGENSGLESLEGHSHFPKGGSEWKRASELQPGRTADIDPVTGGRIEVARKPSPGGEPMSENERYQAMYGGRISLLISTINRDVIPKKKGEEGKEKSEKKLTQEFEQNLRIWETAVFMSMAELEGCPDQFDLQDFDRLQQVMLNPAEHAVPFNQQNYSLDHGLNIRLNTLGAELQLAAMSEGRQLTKEEIKLGQSATRLKKIFEARKILHRVYAERTATCGNCPSIADLAINPHATITAIDYKVLFNSPLGRDIDKALRAIVRVGREKSIKSTATKKEIEDGHEVCVYAGGFDSVSFKKWFKYVYKESGEDMPALLLAWRLAQVWELTTAYGLDHKGKKPVLGNPPIVSDLTKHLFFKAWQKGEHGKAEGRGERFEAGPWATIGRYPPLGRNYLEHIELKYEGKDTNLLELWLTKGIQRKDGKRVALGLWDLPWEKTELDRPGAETGEAPLLSFDGWRRQQRNAEKVRQWLINPRLTLADIRGGEKMGWGGVVKAFNRTFGPKEKKGDIFTGNNPYGHPRALFLIGLITERHPDRKRLKNKGDDRKTVISDLEKMAKAKTDTRDDNLSRAAISNSVETLMSEAIDNGFILPEEEDAILRFCELSTKKIFGKKLI